MDIICKSSSCNWLKNISKLAWPLGDNQLDLDRNAVISLNVLEASLKKNATYISFYDKILQTLYEVRAH